MLYENLYRKVYFNVVVNLYPNPFACFGNKIYYQSINQSIYIHPCFEFSQCQKSKIKTRLNKYTVLPHVLNNKCLYPNRLKDYPQYCQHLTAIPHFPQFPQHLTTYVDYGSRSQEPPAVSRSITPTVSSIGVPFSAPSTVSSDSPAPVTTAAIQTPVTTPVVQAQSKAGSLPKVSLLNLGVYRRGFVGGGLGVRPLELYK